MGKRTAEQKQPAVGAPTNRSAWGTFAWGAGLVVAGIAGFSIWTMWANAQDRSVEQLGHEVVHEYPHDRDAFTQGLVFDAGALYEGTGHEGQSTLRKVDLKSGEVLESQAIGSRLFGEGITILGDKIYQLTWRNGVCLVYDKESMRKIDTLRYRGEGWGLTNDGTHLIMSNGTSTLLFLDPKTLREVRRVSVTTGGSRVDKLNELEYIDGQIYANIWYSDYIVRISPETGKVTAWIDMRGLLAPFSADRPTREHVLNGIAYDTESGRLFVTGKNWPKLFEVKIVGKK